MLRRERASVICIDQDELLVVYLENPEDKITRTYLPGGAVEANETPAAAAIRETWEETGQRVGVVEDSALKSAYPFRWAGKDYLSVTTFFHATLRAGRIAAGEIDDAAYHRGWGWLPLENVREEFDFHGQILEDLLTMIGRIKT